MKKLNLKSSKPLLPKVNFTRAPPLQVNYPDTLAGMLSFIEEMALNLKYTV